MAAGATAGSWPLPGRSKLKGCSFMSLTVLMNNDAGMRRIKPANISLHNTVLVKTMPGCAESNLSTYALHNTVLVKTMQGCAESNLPT